jgi:hypothetical protein
MAHSNYEILKANSPDALATLVAAALTAGKVLYGAPMVEGPSIGYTKTTYAQAVVEDDEAGSAVTEVITITTAQLLALNTTPISIVPAPASGYAIVPVSAVLFLDYAGVAYDGIAGGEDLVFRYTDGSGAIAATIEATGFLDASADAHRVVAFASLAVPTPAAALVLHMTSGNIATGTSPLKLKLNYKRVPLLT